MLDTTEILDRRTHLLRLDTRRQSRQRGRHSVVGIVQTLDLHLRRVDLDRFLAHGRGEHAVAIEVGVARTTRHGRLCRKG